jgi:hypothetical protein
MRSAAEIGHDERGLIVNWLLKLLVGFILLAVVVYDGGSIMVNFFTLDSKADEIAVQLTTGVTPGQLALSSIEPRAQELAEEAGARLLDLRIENNIVYVTLRRRADTLVVGKIDAIADWARATVEGQAGTV